MSPSYVMISCVLRDGVASRPRHYARCRSHCEEEGDIQIVFWVGNVVLIVFFYCYLLFVPGCYSRLIASFGVLFVCERSAGFRP